MIYYLGEILFRFYNDTTEQENEEKFQVNNSTADLTAPPHEERGKRANMQEDCLSNMEDVDKLPPRAKT